MIFLSICLVINSMGQGALSVKLNKTLSFLKILKLSYQSQFKKELLKYQSFK